MYRQLHRIVLILFTLFSLASCTHFEKQLYEGPPRSPAEISAITLDWRGAEGGVFIDHIDGKKVVDLKADNNQIAQRMYLLPGQHHFDAMHRKGEIKNSVAIVAGMVAGAVLIPGAPTALNTDLEWDIQSTPCPITLETKGGYDYFFTFSGIEKDIKCSVVERLIPPKQ